MTDTARQHVKETSTVARWRLIDAALVSAHHLPARWGEIEQTRSDDPATAAQRIIASRPPNPLAAENARLRAALEGMLQPWYGFGDDELRGRRIVELEAALQPFADVSGQFDELPCPPEADETPIMMDLGLCRDARRALEGK
jgi:hypothetical protein